MSILICTDCGASADEDDWKETLDEVLLCALLAVL